MLKEDKDKLIELLKNYPPQEVMQDFTQLALEAAGDLSDDGLKEHAKELVRLSVVLENVTAGLPFLL